jgi:hypothetical protein
VTASASVTMTPTHHLGYGARRHSANRRNLVVARRSP